MSFLELGIPASDATVSVKAFNVVTDMRAVSVPAGAVMHPIPTGRDTFGVPVFAFLIENAATGQRVMFDLGPRKDQENSALPGTIKASDVIMPVERDITEQLVDHGVDLESISAAIWSLFTAATHILTTLVTCRSSPLQQSLCSVRRRYWKAMKRIRRAPCSRAILLAGNWCDSILTKPRSKSGGFKAKDYFGDGSFCILDVPGHLAGHVGALARVTPTSFVFLGGDGCHHPGMLRPTEKLHRHFPCPGHLLAAARRSISVKHFPPADAAGEFDLAARTTPMLDVSEEGIYEDKPTARSSIAKMGDFDANKDVFVVIAHDETLQDVIGPFPVLLNDWKAKGLKDRVLWAFVDEANSAFRFNDKV
ncbi:Metallo-beta-lactamase superfamily protein [Mycena venus]|uniref:Metallo-beta-lactamase superfamily protein n=1 Tax=Mycena venus TaxID=2733690 RepID=A0A8H6YV47_9AGAR|nr:Metallo-beta-lactamase superfamily protein [Mycena venus]